MNVKNINIGKLIKIKCTEEGILMERICNFLKCNEEQVEIMYESESIDSENLLRWSKLLQYDFFRLYSQHLILYSPPSATEKKNRSAKSVLPQYRKNIYTKEIIDFIIELVENKEKTKLQIIEEYRIPKTTLYKWIEKYKKLKF